MKQQLLTNMFSKTKHALTGLNSLSLLGLRLYLAPIFIMAGYVKLTGFDGLVDWLGDGLGLPLPMLMAVLVICAELIGGVALLFGVATRLFSFMLIITMLVAMFSVHWDHGWFAITPIDPDTSMAKLFSMFGFDSANQSLANSAEAGERLMRAKEILQEYGNYDYLTETGGFAILNNGIEFAATYAIMLLVLLTSGAGSISIDKFICRLITNEHKKEQK